MVYAITLKGKLSFKQDFSNIETLLKDQRSTYALLRYCPEIPSKLYSTTMKQLSCESDRITDRKLMTLVKKFIKASGCVILMDEEVESSFFIDPKTGKILTEDQIEMDGDIPRIKVNPEEIGISDDDGDFLTIGMLNALEDED